MHLTVIGLSHRTCSISERERFLSLANRRAEVAHAIREKTFAAESMLVSTCNRFEVYAISKKEIDSKVLTATIEALAPKPPTHPTWYIHKDKKALLHMLRVASGLDSMVVGEPQVLAQLKDSCNRSQIVGASGEKLGKIVDCAVSIAIKVRDEAALGKNSVASLAAKHAAHLMPDVSQAKAVVIGAGEVGIEAAKHLVKMGFSTVSVASRTRSHSNDITKRAKATFLPWSELKTSIGSYDVVIAAASSKEPIIKRMEVEALASQTSEKTLHILDIATPRNVDVDLKTIQNINLMTIDDLKCWAAAHCKADDDAIARAEKLINAESKRVAPRLCL